MVSYRQLASGQIVLQEKDLVVSESGHVRGMSLQQEDADFFYTFDSRGGLSEKRPKSNLDKYIWWHTHNVQFNGEERITPLTDFEKALGITLYRTSFDYRGQVYTQEDFERLFRDNPDSGFCNAKGQCDWSNVGEHSYKDIPTRKEDGDHWNDYFVRKATEQNLITVSVGRLEFKEKQKPAVVEKVRPNPKAESIASVKIEKPEPVEPIKEVEKYSPLMIAGVIAVVVILLLKRRRA